MKSAYVFCRGRIIDPTMKIFVPFFITALLCSVSVTGAFHVNAYATRFSHSVRRSGEDQLNQRQPWFSSRNTCHTALEMMVPGDALAVTGVSPLFESAISMSMSSSSAISSASMTLSESIKTQYETSPEPIHTAFTVATFLPQPFWLLMILFPKSSITKKIMGGLGTCSGSCCRFVLVTFL